MVDYGYGDAAPDSNTASAGKDDPYGYGDATPDVSKYGYGDATPDTEYEAGYNDQTQGNGGPRRVRRGADGNDSDDNMSTASGHSVDSNGNPKPPRHRTRRRNSVTRYSLVANEEAAQVAKEHEVNNTRIEQFRQGMLNGGGLDMVPQPGTGAFSGGVTSIAGAAAAAESGAYTSEADRILQQQLQDDDPQTRGSTSSVSGEDEGEEGTDGKKGKKGGRLGRGMRAIGRRFSVGT